MSSRGVKHAASSSRRSLQPSKHALKQWSGRAIDAKFMLDWPTPEIVLN
jgi:hypothetical protein